MKNKLKDVFSIEALRAINSAKIKISDLNENFGTVTLVGKVIRLFDEVHETIAQAGLLGDETGTTKFVIWKSAKERALKKNKVYTFENYKVSTYNDQISIVSDKASALLDSNVKIDVHEAQSEASDLMAFVVEVKKAAITKLCDNPLDKDCKEKTKWGFDVRMVLDSGNSTLTVDIRDFTLLDLTVASVKKTIMESGDPSLLLKTISEKVSGRYLILEREYEAQRYLLITNEQLLKMVK